MCIRVFVQVSPLRKAGASRKTGRAFERFLVRLRRMLVVAAVVVRRIKVMIKNRDRRPMRGEREKILRMAILSLVLHYRMVCQTQDGVRNYLGK